jgi:hypothetical protein
MEDHSGPRQSSSTREFPMLPLEEAAQPRECPRCKSPRIPLGMTPPRARGEGCPRYAAKHFPLLASPS